MTLAAIIGGSGLTNLKNLEITHREVKRTPFGEPSSPMVYGRLGGQAVVFLARHGHGHTIPPHEVNYRANIWSIKETGATRVIAINAVGGIADALKSGQLVFPDQIIDYTYSRAHSFFGNDQKSVTHIDFSEPYCEELRQIFIRAARAAGIKAAERATYAATQGPRFETIAEIKRLERDGGDIVGMTGMPETCLARELGLCYASIAVVANPAAGKAAGEISLKQIERTLEGGMETVRALLERIIPLLLTV